MVQEGFRMLRMWALGLAWLVFVCTTVYESSLGTNAASVNHSYRKTCLETEKDIHMAVCCENSLHHGPKLSCCGEKAFNPADATCCEVQQGDTIAAYITEGLSQEVSSCCGPKAYNSLYETCCDTTVVAKPGPNAQCCGKEAYDPDKQMCCGPIDTVVAKPAPNAKCCDNKAYDPDKQICCGRIGSRVILTRESSHHLCCGQNQYDPRSHCCCCVNETLQIDLISSSCCVKKSALCGAKAYNPLKELRCQSTVVAKPAPNAKCCDNKAYDPDKQICCGRIGSRVILTRESSHHLCCGQNQYDPRSHCCCCVNETLQIDLISSSCCVKKSALCGAKAYNPLKELRCQSTVVAKPAPNAKCCDNKAYDPDKQICCGRIGSRVILTRESSHHLCCGQNQYDPRSHCCCCVNETLQIDLISSSCCVKKSALCGAKAYNPLKELRCQSTVVAKPAPNAECCDNKAYDPDKQICCGRIGSRVILTRESSHHLCCGQNQYDPRSHCCCCVNETLQIDLISSSCCVKKSALCGAKAYNPLKELRCQSTVVAKPAPNAECCDNKAYDPDKQICCGRIGSRVILTRESSHHLCCGQNQYDPRSHCCCCINETLQINLISSSCCVKKSGLQQQKPGPQPNCTEPQTSLCGSSCYNLNEFHCCERDRTKCTPGGCDVFPTVYNPHTHVCCDGHVSEGKPWMYQIHGSLGHYCCGTDVYQPHTEICCDGHRHPKDENTHCCGIHAYHSKKQHKCCDGTLYSLSLLGTLGHEARCCGSTLQNAKDVCCPLHQPGHHQKMIKESRLESVNDLNEIDLCKEMLIGTVEMVSLHSIIFGNVMKIHGRNGTVNPVALTHTLKTPDRCNTPKVFPGKTYSFDEVNVFIDFNHDSILQSIHFIMSKCYCL